MIKADKQTLSMPLAPKCSICHATMVLWCDNYSCPYCDYNPMKGWNPNNAKDEPQSKYPAGYLSLMPIHQIGT